MRKVLFFLFFGILFGFSSCVDTYYVTKKSTFDTAIQSVQAEMAQKGFTYIGTTTNTRNETVVTGVSYSKTTGYGTAMANNFITQDTYKFSDSLGRTMNYSVSYQKGETKEGLPYVDDVSVCGCETSVPVDYVKLCGKESEVYQLNDLSKDQKIERVNTLKTTMAFSVPAVFVSLLIVLIL